MYKNYEAVINNKKKLADFLRKISINQLNNLYNFKADVFFTQNYVAIASPDLNQLTRKIFHNVKIENDKIFIENNLPVSIIGSHLGLNFLQVMMLAKESIKNSSDSNLRKDILLIFKEQENIFNKIIIRLIYNSLDSHIHWIKAKIDESDYYFIRIFNAPMYEILNFLDEPSYNKKFMIYRRLFIGSKGTFLFVPWGYDYPVIEEILPKILQKNNLNCNVLADEKSFFELPDINEFKSLYDPSIKFLPFLTANKLPVVNISELPEISIPISLRKKFFTDKLNAVKSTIFLFDMNQLDFIKEQLCNTSESELNELDSAILEIDNKEIILIRCSNNIEKIKAIFSDRIEIFQKWDKGINIYLPDGYEFFPSLSNETYQKAIGNIDYNDIVILRLNMEELSMFHFSDVIFQPLINSIVKYTVNINESGIKNIIDSSIIDFDKIIKKPSKVSYTQFELPKVHDVQLSNDKTIPNYKNTSKSLESKQSGNLSTILEIDNLIYKARLNFLNQKEIYYDNILEDSEWEKLLFLTFLSKTKNIDNNSVLNKMLFSGDFDIIHIFSEFSNYDEKILIEKLNNILNEALKILIDTKPLMNSLRKLFGNLIKVKSSPFQIEILSVNEIFKGLFNKPKDIFQNDNIKIIKKELERALLFSVIPDNTRKIVNSAIESLLSVNIALYKNFLIIFHELYETPMDKLIGQILENYENAGWKKWEEVYKLNMNRKFLDKISEEGLLTKIIFDAPSKQAKILLESYILDKDFLKTKKLNEFIESDKNPLNKKILTLYYMIFFNSCASTDELIRRVTDLDQLVSDSKDIYLQSFFAECHYKLTNDNPFFTRIQSRIKRFIRENDASCLVLPFIEKAVSEKNELMHKIYLEETLSLFKKYDSFLSIWNKLLDAWGKVNDNPDAFGNVPSCLPTSDCSLNSKCPIDSPEENGFYCIMKRELDGIEIVIENNITNFLSIFKAFFNIIKQAANGKTISDILENNSKSDDNSSLLCKFIYSELNPSKKGIFYTEFEQDLITFPADWDKDEEKLIELLDLLTFENIKKDKIYQKIKFLKDQGLNFKENFLLLTDIPNIYERMQALFSIVYKWTEFGIKKPVNFLLDKASKLSQNFYYQINPKEVKFLLSYISILIKSGQTDHALIQTELMLDKEFLFPAPEQHKIVTELCRILSKISMLDKIKYREKMKDSLKNSRYFKNFNLDNTNLTMDILELFKEVFGIFKWRSKDVEDTIENLMIIERKKILNRINKDYMEA